MLNHCIDYQVRLEKNQIWNFVLGSSLTLKLQTPLHLSKREASMPVYINHDAGG